MPSSRDITTADVITTSLSRLALQVLYRIQLLFRCPCICCSFLSFAVVRVFALCRSSSPIAHGSGTVSVSGNEINANYSRSLRDLRSSCKRAFPTVMNFNAHFHSSLYGSIHFWWPALLDLTFTFLCFSLLLKPNHSYI
jgi:hypothetical protein